MTHLAINSERRRALHLLGVTAFSWALAGRYAHAQSAAVQGPEQLRIGYQKSAVNLVILKQQGVLEKRFPGTRISWLEFPAGPQLLEALSVGSLEFGLTGDSPPVFAQAAGKDLLYVGAEPPKPDSSALLVLNDSPLRKLADLKGRRIAVQKGSSAHYLLVRAVEKAGLQWADIQPVYLAPADARAAFERKSVDAWASGTRSTPPPSWPSSPACWPRGATWPAATTPSTWRPAPSCRPIPRCCACCLKNSAAPTAWRKRRARTRSSSLPTSAAWTLAW